MKSSKPLLGIIALAVAMLSNAEAQIVFTNGLVAYYPFNGNANDDTGNGYNLINYGATLCADRFENPNDAFSFDGTNYFATSTPPLTQIDNWTMSAWILPSSLTQQTAEAVCMGYDNGSSGNGYGFGISGGNQLWAFFGGVNFLPCSYNFTSTNKWVHVAMESSSGVVTFYVNGVSTTDKISVAPVTPTTFEIGSSGPGKNFYGAIDDVRIYNRALSAAEVGGVYQYEATTPTDCAPRNAEATATVVDGFVVAATLNDPGCGYTNTPSVWLVGGGGTGATATATLVNGIVTGINMTDAGIGYSSTPAVVIASPLVAIKIDLIKAVVPTFSGLFIGSNYQLQASRDLAIWSNAGPVFTATNIAMPSASYFAVTNWDDLYFRLEGGP